MFSPLASFWITWIMFDESPIFLSVHYWKEVLLLLTEQDIYLLKILNAEPWTLLLATLEASNVMCMKLVPFWECGQGGVQDGVLFECLTSLNLTLHVMWLVNVGEGRMYVLHCWISYIHVHWWLPFLCEGHEGATVVSALVMNPDLVQVLLQFLHSFFLAGSRVEGLSKCSTIGLWTVL